MRFSPEDLKGMSDQDIAAYAKKLRLRAIAGGAPEARDPSDETADEPQLQPTQLSQLKGIEFGDESSPDFASLSNKEMRNMSPEEWEQMRDRLLKPNRHRFKDVQQQQELEPLGGHIKRRARPR